MHKGSGLNDGQWHSVELNARQDHLSITVDKDAGATAHTRIPLPLTADSQLFFGGNGIVCVVSLVCVCIWMCIYKPSLVKCFLLRLKYFALKDGETADMDI